MSTNSCCEISLSGGGVAIVDAGDYNFLMQWKWFYLNKLYAARTKFIGIVDGKAKRMTVKMHNVLMPPAEGYEIDHINGNGLDNRKSNLRICKHQQNMWNRKAVTGSASKYKGVDWYAASGSWRAYIKIDGKQKHLGCYKSEDDAARAYNKAAIELHGEFARLNPVEGNPAPRILHPYQGKQRKKEVSHDCVI